MKLKTTSSPHIRSRQTTSRIMFDVVIALFPALLVGIWQFGPRGALVTLVSVVSTLAAEWLFRLATRQHNTLPDGSAAVTGLLLAMTLPASVPYYIPVVGAFFAIVVVKGLCGGLGQNIFNPALAARAFLMLLWPSWLVRFPELGTFIPVGAIDHVDIVSSATPLHHMVMPAMPEVSVRDMFLGNVSGCIGEISALALIMGGIYLAARKVISLRIPAAYLGTLAVLSLVFARNENAMAWMLYSLLGGGVMLGAIFMATDYATSPVLPRAQWIYGIGCGVLTVVFRRFGLYPEGVTYAILIMNAAVWLADRYIVPTRFGQERRGKK